MLVEHINCLVPPSMPGSMNIKGNAMMPIKHTRTIAVEEKKKVRMSQKETRNGMNDNVEGKLRTKK
jgi:hypothetical protein